MPNTTLHSFVTQTITGQLAIEDQKQFLQNLNQKGITSIDIAELVKLLYKHTEKIQLPEAIDICGTGGSGLDRINTSTISAFILAACNVPIAKHGNKASSGRFGSFDLLESLGININLDSRQLEKVYGKTKLAFIFARNFHPVFRHFAQARQELGAKTIFNLLGPLLNPANPDIQIIGTSNESDMQLIIEAAKILDKKKMLVLSGNDGLDELTLTGKTQIMELKDNKIKSYSLRPEDFGFAKIEFEKIAGGDPEFNLNIARDILANKSNTEHLNLVLANAALVLKFLNKAESYEHGVSIARDAIAQKKAQEVFENYKKLV
jgi:anthranilate phosphoribosyltransferase